MLARHAALATAARMARRSAPTERLTMLRRHLSAAANQEESPVVFQNDRSTRTFILNQPASLNSLNSEMVHLLRDKLKEWDSADLCEMIIGRGAGRAFCAGGNVRECVAHMRDPATAYKAVEFFKTEFELDYLTSTLKKPYIAILDGITMGGGVGLCIHAPFRVATEKTLFAMPETKIGYFPDVGASFFLSRLDGELGTYLALTGNNLKGRDVFRLGLATHYIPSRRVPDLLERLASLEKAKVYSINTAIEEFSQELHSEEPPMVLKGEVRKVLDDAFGHDTVPQIFAALETAKKRGGPAAEWASATLRDLHMRSPTSLAVALKALRLGKTARRLEQVFATELLIATAYCNGASRDFEIGVTAKLEQPKVPDDVRVEWQPSTIQDIKPVTIQASFFDRNSPFFGGDKQPTLDIAVPEETPPSFLRFSLPSEYYVESVVKGTDSKSTPLALTREEVMNEVLKTFNWKHGVREKVDEILDRKTQVLNDPDNVGCLGWVSS